MSEARLLRLRGLVQGVGFRPFVYRLATALDLGGQVGNDTQGVFIRVEGPQAVLQEFLRRLPDEAPPAARIDHIDVQSGQPQGCRAFEIVDSVSRGAGVVVAADQAICHDCRRELFDPADRRYGYPFLNCTQCGPRYTILRATPYDRALTTMQPFTMCLDCQGEYYNPRDRRFHAQPNACRDCGPQLQLLGAEGWREGPGILDEACRLLRQGGILGIKGLGGFHLACDADNASAVARLRRVKSRPHQPLAHMARDLASLRRRLQVDEAEAQLLEQPAHPIVILQGGLGVMLPYTGLHQWLLQNGPEWLVMTSANPPGAPIEYESPSAVLEQADCVLSHDRAIQAPCDDSLAFVFAGQPLLLRRSRGYAPLPLSLPFVSPPLLAVGGELKNTFGLAEGQQAYLSPHLGDMQNLETLQAFESSLRHFQQLFRIQPQAIAVDLHPGYLSRGWAQQQALPLVPVQHHHAHLAALMTEHHFRPDESLVGFCFDGTGYGPDGTLWGGETLLASYQSYQRLAHLTPMPIVGGEAALRSPYRLALTYLWACRLESDVIECEPKEAGWLHRQWQLGRQVMTTSLGRLFDVISVLCGCCRQVTFEGQAAWLLQECFEESACGCYHLDTRWEVAELLTQVLADLAAGATPGQVSARFHRALARAMREQAVSLGADRVGLSGGVFQNRILLKLAVEELSSAGIQVLWHRQVPPNDGGLALGQLAVASQQPPGIFQAQEGSFEASTGREEPGWGAEVN